MTEHPIGRWVIRTVRIGITVALLTFLVRRAGGEALLHELSKVSPPWLLAATLANVALVVFGVLRWRVLIAAKPPGLTSWTLGRLFVTSCFYGAIGPGMLGVDAVRVMLLARRGTGRTAAAVSVTADRMVGLVTQVMFALPTFATLGLVPMMAGNAPGALVREVIGKARVALGNLARQPWRIAAGWGLSLITISLWGVVGWCTLNALGHTVPLGTVMSFVACGELASAIPLTVQGVGARELVFASLLAPHGVAAADATLLGLLMYAQVLVPAVGGAIATVTAHELPPRAIVVEENALSVAHD